MGRINIDHRPESPSHGMEDGKEERMSTTQFSVTLCKWVERERDFPEIFESIVTIYFVATMYLSDDRIFGMRREVIRCIYDNLYAKR